MIWDFRYGFGGLGVLFPIVYIAEVEHATTANARLYEVEACIAEVEHATTANARLYEVEACIAEVEHATTANAL